MAINKINLAEYEINRVLTNFCGSHQDFENLNNLKTIVRKYFECVNKLNVLKKQGRNFTLENTDLYRLGRFIGCSVFAWNVYGEDFARLGDFIFKFFDVSVGDFAKGKIPISFVKDNVRTDFTVVKNKYDFFCSIFDSFKVGEIVDRDDYFKDKEAFKKTFVTDFLSELDYVNPVINQYNVSINSLQEEGCLVSQQDLDRNKQCENLLTELKDFIEGMRSQLNCQDYGKFLGSAKIFHGVIVNVLNEIIKLDERGDFFNGGYIVDQLHCLKNYASQDSLTLLNALENLIKEEQGAEDLLMEKKYLMQQAIEGDAQNSGLCDAREKYQTAVKMATAFIKEELLLPGRFPIFSTKHLEPGRILLEKRLDTNLHIPASSAYYSEESLLIALNDVLSWQEQQSITPTKEVTVFHQQPVGLSVLRNSIRGLTQVECNATRVSFLGGQVAHIYPCWVDLEQNLGGGSASTSSQISAPRELEQNPGPVHPTLAHHLGDRAGGAQPKSTGKKGKSKKR
jgi:hypothetical protein